MLHQSLIEQTHAAKSISPLENLLLKVLDGRVGAGTSVIICNAAPWLPCIKMQKDVSVVIKDLSKFFAKPFKTILENTCFHNKKK